MYQRTLVSIGSRILLAAVLLFGAYTYFRSLEEKHSMIDSFDACVSAGYTVSATYPEECKIPGKVFTNPRQKKEESTSLTKPDNKEVYGNLEYVINGAKVKVATSSLENALQVTATFYEDTLNDDALKDVVFVAVTKNTNPNYYFLLALGLYNGGYAPANGLLLSKEQPLSIVKDAMNILTVTSLCETATCTKKFTIKNDILEEIKTP